LGCWCFARARLLVVHLPPSLPFQDEDKCGLGCWCFARARTPTVPPQLDCWWWILTLILAVYWEGQHDWLGTLGRPHRCAFTAFELPVIGGILNFFFSQAASSVSIGRRRWMGMNGAVFRLGRLFSIWCLKFWHCLIKPLVQIVIGPLDFGAYSLWSLKFNFLQLWLELSLNFDSCSIKPLIALIY
jgi:hypothetical protein